MVTGLAQQTRPVILKEVLRTTTRLAISELVVCCPKCKTFETLTFTQDGTIRTRKFSQENSHIYHDCGSTEPCRVFRAL